MEIEKEIKNLETVLKNAIFIQALDSASKETVVRLIEDILNEVSKDLSYEIQYSEPLVQLFEQYYDFSANYLAHVFLKNLNGITSMSTTKWEKRKVIRKGEEIMDDYFSFKSTVTKDKKSVSLDEPLTIDLDPQTAEEFLDCLIYAVRDQMLQADLSKSIHLFFFDLWICRNIANKIDRRGDFYFLLCDFVHGLILKEHFENARFFHQNGLICSYKDKVPEYGYLLLFKSNTQASNCIKAFYYGILLTKASQRKETITDALLKSIIIEAVRCFRRCHFDIAGVTIFKNMPATIEFDSSEKTSLTSAYFYCKLELHNDDNLPDEVIEYLNLNKEDIINDHETSIASFLVLLWRLKKEFTLSGDVEVQANNYIDLFRSRVRRTVYEKHYTALFGSLEDTKLALMHSLVRLSRTKDSSDFVNDNKFAVSIAHRLLNESYTDGRPDCYLIAMILKADFTLIFENKAGNVTNLNFGTREVVEEFEGSFMSPTTVFDALENLIAGTVVWLGGDGYNILPMIYSDKTFLFIKGGIWRVDKTMLFSGHLGLLAHLPTTKRKNTPYIDKLDSDYEKETLELKGKLSYTELDYEINSSVFVIKDLDISVYPHNLLLDKIGFVITRFPIVNVMSTEFFIKNLENSKRQIIRSKSIWIPIDPHRIFSEMIELQNKLEDTFNKFSINQNYTIPLNEPLASDINIVVAHGNKSFNTTPAFYFEFNTELNIVNELQTIIGPGKVLILFVCHSGTQDKDFFRTQTNTAIKHFLQSGYKAVIAPFWALSTLIPSIWLPVFLDSFEAGDNITTSVWKANMYVKSIYNTPHAYACLHLYGYPFLTYGS